MSKPITAALFILLAAAAPQLFAQNFGEITGTVADSSGAVIASAAVSVTNTATNQVRRTTTNFGLLCGTIDDPESSKPDTITQHLAGIEGSDRMVCTSCFGMIR